MQTKTLSLVLLLICIGILCFFLAACGGKSQSVQTNIVLEPEAKEAGSPLSPEEVTALKSEGEIDRELPSTAEADVTKQFVYYLHKRRNHITTSIKRCEKYLPYARGIFEKNGMPKDLAYLAIVESGYNRNAVSPSGAAGVWQFMKRTGSAYGLEQDTWTDERFDFYEATEAAATYLKKLHRDFNDWPTAIAAYNSGEGKMRRALEGSGSRNFFEVRERNETLSDSLKLREETKQYVPRFLAVTKIMRNLSLLNLPEIDKDKAVRVTRVTAEPGTDLKSVAKALSLDWEEFRLLNKHQPGIVTSATRKTYLYVPEAKAAQAQELLAHSHPGEFAGWKTCTIDSAESWKTLERRYHVSAEKLRNANPRCSLKTGEVLFVPGNAATVALERKVASQQETKAAKGHGVTHKLAPKETLYAVAKKYGVSTEDLIQHNHIGDPSHMATGTVLRIPSKSGGPAHGTSYGSLGAKQATKSVHVVQSNDTMWKISRRYNVSIEQLKAWNNIDEHSLRVGDALVVYAK